MSKFTRWLLALIGVFAAIGAFALIMGSFNHNEHMYIAASVLLSQDYELYSDFAYLQMPYLPLLYGAVYRLLGIHSYYLLSGKLISFCFFILSALGLYLIARRVLPDVTLALGITVLFLMNGTIVGSATEASNYIMPVALSLMSFFLFLISIPTGTTRGKPLGIALAGLLAALAIGSKLTHAVIVIPFLLVSPLPSIASERWLETRRQRAVYLMLPFLAGIAVGLVPVFFYLLADPQAFVFNNLGYHAANTQWRQMTGYEGPMSLSVKILYARYIFFKAENLIVVLGVLFGVAVSLDRLQAAKWNVHRSTPGAFLAVALFIAAILAAIVPTPSFHQYYTLALTLLFVLLIYSWSASLFAISALAKRLLLILVLISAVYNVPVWIEQIAKLTTRDGWVGFHVHDVSWQVRQVLVENEIGAHRKVATLSPLFAIESSLPIYVELSTGPFLYRVGDLLSPEQRAHVVGTSPGSIADLLQRDPPGAILVGLEGDLEGPLIEYAVTHNYQRVDIPGFVGTLYIEP